MLAAFLSTRARGAAVLIGIPREDAVLPLPALHDPAHGAARARLDLRLVVAGARLPADRSSSTVAGRLPLDRLVSHRLPLDEVGRAFELMRSGEALRVVLDLKGAA